MSINRPERKKSAVKAAAILEGARQEFLAYGYASTSMDRVASAAGVSKATVYSHFHDKAGLFSALVKQLAEDRFQTLLFDPQDEPTLQGDPRVVLTDLAQKFLDEAAYDSQFCEFMRLIFGESGRFPELSNPYIENVAKPLIDVLTRYLSNCETLHLADPEAIARTFMGTLVYFIILQRVLGGASLMPIESDRMISTLVDLIAPSVQNPSRPA
ncbi:MAG: TetR family transcriptional regulator [Leptolyngbya foveolarum]|uniref:TetR family transcriptional regulator n=1 Tax=Leptolyngbya foveolarum TaxID=47253 RepID=A0A2W4U083_9CYAN|nr:MAG: TetR family transcriptional regulator [Leptolyngbya foveolarum]